MNLGAARYKRSYAIRPGQRIQLNLSRLIREAKRVQFCVWIINASEDLECYRHDFECVNGGVWGGLACFQDITAVICSNVKDDCRRRKAIQEPFFTFRLYVVIMIAISRHKSV